MINSLTITLYANNTDTSIIEDMLFEVFKLKPILFTLPLNKQLKNVIEKSRGEIYTYKLNLNGDSFEKTTFELLIKLEEFGTDWTFRKPVRLLENKYMFTASLFPEYGTIFLKDINGITVLLEEGIS